MRIALLLLTIVPLAQAQDKQQERYANMPSEAVPYRGFTKPYKEWYLSPDTLQYNGAARDHDNQAFLRLDTVNLGFIGPLENGPEMAYGQAMLHGAQMAIDEANASGGYAAPDGRKRPYKLMIHNDSAQWGASSTEIVKMDMDEHVLAVLGSVDGASTHIMLRVTLKLEIPIVDTGTTDPTVTETRIPWLIHNFPDDRQQGYALADCVFKQHKLQRVGVLRGDARYARVGVRKFADEAQRLGHTPVLEVKFSRGDKDFATQLRMLKNARVQGIVIWGEAADAGVILKQMRGLGMTQRVFGPSRMAVRELIETAGAAAEGVTTTVALDPTRSDAKWRTFVAQYRTKYEVEPDAYAAYGFDGMNMMIKAVAKAGLNRGLIMDALREYGAHSYDGVAGQVKFDYTLNNVSPVGLAQVENGQFVYGAPYARIDREAVSFNGPGREAANDIGKGSVALGLVTPLGSDVLKAAQTAVDAENAQGFPNGRHLILAPEDESAQWGRVSEEMAKLALNENTLALLTGASRQTAHQAEQIANKVGLPVVTLSNDATLNQVNIPWIFRLPQDADVARAVHLLAAAMRAVGPNRARVRDWLAANETFDHAGNPGTR